MQKYCFLISDIIKTKERSIVVKTNSGKKIALPRSQAEFFRGKVCIPLWLAMKLAAGTPLPFYFKNSSKVHIG